MCASVFCFFFFYILFYTAGRRRRRREVRRANFRKRNLFYYIRQSMRSASVPPYCSGGFFFNIFCFPPPPFNDRVTQFLRHVSRTFYRVPSTFPNGNGPRKRTIVIGYISTEHLNYCLLSSFTYVFFFFVFLFLYYDTRTVYVRTPAVARVRTSIQ